ncbi:MAG: PAS domain S-box protein [Acidimicrobiia bacterium]|nr:PAS domain S-box protein [Acidimicrobiia bacterium]
MAMRIGELARRTGVQAGTLRAWERRFGLLQPTRTKGGQRHYSEADVARIATVRRLVNDGMTLAAAAERVVSAGDSAPPSEVDSRLLQQVLQTLDHGVLVGKDAQLRYVNRTAARMLGLSVDEFLTRSLFDFILEEDRPWAKETQGGLRQGETPAPFDMRLRRVDGTTIVVESTVRPMFDRAGRYEGSVSIMRDVTAQRAAEAQDRFRVAMLDAVAEALMAVTSDGTIAYMNEAAEKLWGWKAEDVVGRPAESFPVVDGAQPLLDDLRAHAAAGEPYDCEIPTPHADGSTVPCHFMMRPVRSRDGDLLGRIIVFRDLREQRRLDDELRIRDLRASTVAVLGARAVAKGSDSASADDTLLHETVEAARRLLGADRALILEVEDDGKLAVRAASPDDALAAVPPGSGSLAGFTVLARAAVIVDDVASERRFDTGTLAPETRSAVAVPVLGPGGVRGVLLAQTSTVRSFDDAAVAFLHALANVIGAALK